MKPLRKNDLLLLQILAGLFIAILGVFLNQVIVLLLGAVILMLVGMGKFSTIEIHVPHVLRIRGNTKQKNTKRKK